MKVNLSYREAEELQELLMHSIGELKSEIRHSQMQETKKELKKKKEDLMHILEQIETGPNRKAA